MGTGERGWNLSRICNDWTDAMQIRTRAMHSFERWMTSHLSNAAVKNRAQEKVNRFATENEDLRDNSHGTPWQLNLGRRLLKIDNIMYSHAFKCRRMPASAGAVVERQSNLS